MLSRPLNAYGNLSLPLLEGKTGLEALDEI